MCCPFLRISYTWYFSSVFRCFPFFLCIHNFHYVGYTRICVSCPGLNNLSYVRNVILLVCACPYTSYIVHACSLSNTMSIWIYGLLLPASCKNQLNNYACTNVESHVRFADWYAPINISSSAECSVLHALQFQEVRVRRILPSGTDATPHLITAFPTVSLISAMKRPLLNTEHDLIYECICAYGLGYSAFDMVSPCHPIENDIKMS
jgi:hypothetical protein